MIINFYGELAARFGRRFELPFARTPAQAMEHLGDVIPGLRRYLLDNSERGFHVLSKLRSIGEDELEDPSKQIHVMPAVVGGGGKGGIFKVILGAALALVGAFVLRMPFITKIGISLMMGGVAQMLAPAPPKMKPTGENNYDDPGHNFNGIDNVVAQDQVIPVVYGGPLEVGSLVVSLGTSSDSAMPVGKGGGPFGTAANGGGDVSLWERMSSTSGVSAWFNGGDGDSVPWVWNVDPR